jgi:5'-methylthioadenosine phosphorylase
MVISLCLRQKNSNFLNPLLPLQEFTAIPQSGYWRISMHDNPSLAIIGGSGIYSMPGLSNPKELEIETPFGNTSAPIMIGTIEGKKVAFLARHGIGHHITPSEVPYRANIYALKTLGVERIVSINACGSLREDYVPGDIVIPDQIFDNTRNRARSFFGEGLVAHVSVADPFCPDLSNALASSVTETKVSVHRGGAFMIIEGPRFSTKTESNTYRAWGMSIVGMTAAPEAFLAREAEICYSVMAHVTDYDVWHVSESPVTVEMVVKILNQNALAAQAAIQHLITSLPKKRACSCDSALSSAIITQPSAIPSITRKKLDLLVKKYLK